MTLREILAVVSVLSAIATGTRWVQQTDTIQALVVELGGVSVRFSVAQQEKKCD